MRRKIIKFFKTDGFIYLIYVYIVTLIGASITFALVEKVHLATAFWWGIVTTTTVGYGDIAPQTSIGKVAAVVLMFVGIAFIAMLASAITTYFGSHNLDQSEHEILSRMTELQTENQKLARQLDELTQLMIQQQEEMKFLSKGKDSAD